MGQSAAPSDLYTLGRCEAAEAHRAAARKNLAALICERHGINPSAGASDRSRLTEVASEFALLADILGLNPAPATPLGCCPACGQPRSLTASREHLRHDRACRARDRK
jgi:hypothetical protein